MHIIRLFQATFLTVVLETAALTAQTSIPGSLDPGRLSSISVRAFSGNGDQVLIAGFALNGTTTRPFLLRAIGPGLAPFGVTNYMLDPELKLFRTSSETVTNELWNADTELIETQRRLGAFSLDPSSRDAAVYIPLSPGTYTAHALGHNGSTGDVLLEVYDASENPQFGSSISAVSLRGELGPQTPLMIGGFFISPGAPKQVLIRAIGPTLASFGIGSALGNPRIRLVQNGEVIYENDDWTTGNDVSAMQQAFADSGAFGLTEGTQDAAMVVTLSPGAYTAHIDDPTGGTGVVLAEVYDLDPPDPLAIPANPVPSGAMPGISIIALTDEVTEGKTPGARIMIVRSGDLSSPLSVHLNTSGTASAADFTSLPDTIYMPNGSATKMFTVGAWNDGIFESPEILTVSIRPDTGYSVQGSGLAHIVVRDGSTDTGTGWQAEYFNNNSLSGTPAIVRTDPTIDFNWEGNSPGAGVESNNFSSRWTGLLQIETTDDYTFSTRTDDGVRLYVDGVLIIDKWDGYAGEQSATVHLSAGVRYSVRMEHREGGGNARAHLYWQSTSSGREVIPVVKVYQSGATTPIITSPRDVVALVGGPFEYQITATASPRDFSAVGIPVGLTFDSFTGTINGTPTAAGTFQVVLRSSNDAGTGSELLTIHVVSAGAPPDSETWASAGSTLSAPDTPADNVTPITEFDITTAPSTALERVRGYIIPPQSGNYRFWLAASGPAQLYIADSNQAADMYPRSRVESSTGRRAWYDEASQESRMILLEAGKKYYFEALHRPPSGGGHLSLAWSRPDSNNDIPTEIVPEYCLSRYTESTTTADGDTLYLAKIRPVSEVISPASGIISILFDEETLTGSISMSYTGLTSPPTAAYLYSGPQGQTGPLIQALPNGQFKNFNWTLSDSGSLTAQDLADALRDGLIYVVIHTENFPEGELRGQLGIAAGSAKFVPPAPPPVVPSGPLDTTAAGRFLTQATFGPTQAEIARVQQIGIDAWLNQQFNMAPTLGRSQMEALEAIRKASDDRVRMNDFQEIWWDRAIHANDQLRQRVAFALSEILVVSDANSGLSNYPTGMTIYYDTLLRHAFGNFRDLIEEVTLSPIMASYLSMIRNQPPDPAHGIYPDENYAREVMQLFTIGLNKLHSDGTLVLDGNGLPIPTYSQEAIVGLAHVFTGWSYHYEPGEENFRWGPRDFSNPMMIYEEYHDTGQKRLLESMILDENGLGYEDMTAVLDMLFEHENVGPFISQQLIQRLVTSNPSPGYVYRVASVFNDNGSGVRGDLGAVVRAILTDFEARAPEATLAQGYGKLREPLLRMTHLWRAFNASAENGRLSYHHPESSLRQAALRSPTVFNFFEPGFVHPGALAQAGLVAPEFQITNENNTMFLTNELRRAVFRGISYNERQIKLDLTQAETLISQDIGSFVDWLDLVFLNSTLSDDMRNEIIWAVEDLDYPDEFEGSRTAINLIISSPQYSAQK